MMKDERDDRNGHLFLFLLIDLGQKSLLSTKHMKQHKFFNSVFFVNIREIRGQRCYFFTYAGVKLRMKNKPPRRRVRGVFIRFSMRSRRLCGKDFLISITC
jgi:hypothetical protein